MGLSVENLSCARAGRPVLRNLSFEIAAGAAMLLRGPNGAGKSTLLRALAGLSPAQGRVALDGLDRANAPDLYAERIAYAGHLDAIKPQLTVAENLGFWAALFGGGGVTRALDAFDLGPIADRPAHVCSAGQKRRLGLARLLVCERRLWLLDEPTVGLDAEARARFAAAVRAHCAGDGIALIATHVDLGLGAAPELALAPVTADDTGAAEGSDPFLAGSWA